ncbi:MAG: hypothetical protein OIN88_12890 [Candidatus Methanoperedens sp.]|nr:hypothetical protein [Candidatus Methanoperedens sp.]HLB70554.1 hypothetical protein [Candidatus Methanoperedens sp.]
MELLKFEIEKMMTAGNSILILGIAWLLFWLGPAFFLFQEDPRWGHNFALPITFITVGLGYHIRKISCQLAAMMGAFFIVPTLLAFWPWNIATMIAAALAIILLILYLIERGREKELIDPNPRLKAWLKIHLLTFAYLGLAHMTLIFYLVRWQNPEPFTLFLPAEHEVSTSIFNAMLLPLITLAILERFVKKVGSFQVAKAGFIWAILMIIIPLLSISILGQ